MGIAGSIKLEAARTTFLALADGVFAGLKAIESTVFTRTAPVSGMFLEVNALGATGKVAEIIGTRSYQSLRAYANRVRVKRWGPPALRLQAMEIDADTDGLVGSKLAEYMSLVEAFYEDPIFDTLLGNPTCLDGGALLSATHSYGTAGGTWSNLASGVLTPSTMFTMYAAGTGLLLETGKSAGIRFDTLMGGGNNEKMIDDLCGADRVIPIAATGLENYSAAVAAGVKSNWANAKLKGVTAARITGTSKDQSWFMFDTRNESGKPIVLGQKRAPFAEAIIDPTSKPMAQDGNAEFYVEGWAAIAGGFPLATAGYIG